MKSLSYFVAIKLIYAESIRSYSFVRIIKMLCKPALKWYESYTSISFNTPLEWTNNINYQYFCILLNFTQVAKHNTHCCSKMSLTVL